MAKSHTHGKKLNWFFSRKYFQKYLEVVLDELEAVKIAIRNFLFMPIDWNLIPIDWESSKMNPKRLKQHLNNG